MKIIKIIWKLEDDICLEKACVPQFYNVPLEQRDWSTRKLKQFLENTYYYKIIKLEVFY